MFRILLIFLLLVPGITMAKQTLLVRPEQTVRANIIGSDLNRIYVTDDRIAEYVTANGSLDVKTDEEKGELYLKTKNPEDLSTINLFITTEKGYRFNLLLSPKAKAAQTIELKLQQQIGKKTNIFANNDVSYEGKLVELMRAMYNDEQLAEYEVNNKRQTMPKINGLSITRVKSFSNGEWVGEKLTVKNTKKTAIELQQQMFNKAGVIAIGILTTELSPKATTSVFVIRKI